MRSVGVVLMSAMLIAPPSSARQWTTNLASFLVVAGLFGMLSGFFGNAFSIWIPKWMDEPQLSLPTGPMIVLSATFLCLISLLFAPRHGFFIRRIRVAAFRLRSSQENILKALYEKKKVYIPFWQGCLMRFKGWIKNSTLTPLGHVQAEKLIRLHRLWEVYLVHMGQERAVVHHSAEEMEHILTPEIEQQLQYLLRHPKEDPHHRPIPRGDT